jgi:2'-5' RNA ligase
MMETYLVAITPPASIQKTVLAEKRKYPKFSVYHLPPHITLYHAFESEITVQELAIRLKEKLRGATHFTICLDDYSLFENNQNVLFLKPNRTSIKLFSVIHNKVKKAIPPTQKEINTPYRTYNAYNPHLTIAQHIPKRDLTEIKGRLQKPAKSLTDDF